MKPQHQRIGNCALTAHAALRARVNWYFHERVRKSWCGAHIMRGRAPDSDAILLRSNDYLSIATHPAIVQAQVDALRNHGNGLLMSAIFLQDDDDPQLALENEFAAFLSSEAAVLCQSGWCANTGLIQSIADASVPVYPDMLAHMSLHEGIVSSGAVARPFRHNDVEHLERQIQRYGPGVVVVDAVYSTNGSIAPLQALAATAAAHGCILVVDESHSLGTHGPNGEGLVVALGLTDRVHFRTASLAKAFAGRAGLITCDRRFAEYFKFTSRPAIFSSTLLPHEVAGLRTTLDVIRREGWRRARLRHNARTLHQGLTRLGYNVECSSAQIVPLEAGPEHATIRLRDALESRGVFGSVFCAPATPASRSMVRLSVNAGLSDAEIARVLAVCEEIRAEVDLSGWPSTRRRLRRLRPLDRLS